MYRESRGNVRHATFTYVTFTEYFRSRSDDQDAAEETREFVTSRRTSSRFRNGVVSIAMCATARCHERIRTPEHASGLALADALLDNDADRSLLHPI